MSVNDLSGVVIFVGIYLIKDICFIYFKSRRLAGLFDVT